MSQQTCIDWAAGRYSAGALVLTLLGLTHAARAESLKDAWAMALQSDGAVAAARSDREAADADKSQARNIQFFALLKRLTSDGYYTSKIGLIALGAFFPVYLNLLSGILNVDRKLVEVGQIYRLSGFQLIRRVILPAAFPAFVVGLRSGLGLAWMFVVAAEIMGASKGLGFLMVDGQQTGRPAVIMASVFLFAVLGKATDAAVQGLGRRWLKDGAGAA